jgi:hypothetical protein
MTQVPFLVLPKANFPIFDFWGVRFGGAAPKGALMRQTSAFP